MKSLLICISILLLTHGLSYAQDVLQCNGCKYTIEYRYNEPRVMVEDVSLALTLLGAWDIDHLDHGGGFFSSPNDTRATFAYTANAPITKKDISEYILTTDFKIKRLENQVRALQEEVKKMRANRGNW